MEPTDTVFTAYNENRKHTITLLEGKPLTFGRAHIVYQRSFMATKIDAIKHTVEHADIGYKDKDYDNRERIYCLGADSTRPFMYMTVVVQYNSIADGTIITAWPTDKITGGGDIAYIKPKY